MTAKIAIVGSGPSGFYSAEALLSSGQPVEVDMLERLPSPFGLVRYGVAPDHQKLKQVITTFEAISSDPRFGLFGNVSVGRDVSVKELSELYDAVILANGASTDRPLGVPGEELPGSYSATEFVSWYNGHPDHRHKHFDLSRESVVVIGQGNVAIDVCRILAKSVDELKATDICEHALAKLSASKVRHIYLIGRRGPAQAKFTAKELRELGTLSRASVSVAASDLDLGPACLAEAQRQIAIEKNISIFRSFSGAGDRKPVHIHIKFLLSPLAIYGNARVEYVRFQRNKLSGQPHQQLAVPSEGMEDIEAGAVFRSVGYRGSAIEGVPFDEISGTIPNNSGRVVSQGTEFPTNIYAAGWIKRGPSGIIGTNRACSFDTVGSVLDDLRGRLTTKSATGRRGLVQLLSTKKVRTVDLTQWKRIDSFERTRGAEVSKPREKLTTIEEMLDIALSAET